MAKTKKTKKPQSKVVEAEIVEAEEPASDEGPTPDIDDAIEATTDPKWVESELPDDIRKLPVVVDKGAITTFDPVNTYIAEIKKYPLLTKEQEHQLAVLYRETGDAKAAEKLVTANLRFVVKVAAEYSRFGAKLIDLIQEGNVGLMHAVREFNPYKGVRLITYAVWWIRGYIQEYLMRQYSMVRIGTTQAQRKLFYKLQKEKQLLESMGQSSDTKLLSTRLGVTEEEVKSMTQRLRGRDISLNQPLDDESSATLLDLEKSTGPNTDDQLELYEQISALRENIEHIRPKLNEKEAYILEHRLLADEPLTLQDIGDHYKITREAVRQVEARLLQKIRAEFLAQAEGLSDSQNDS